MSSLPASMKKIRSKMKALEWTQHFPHYNSMVAMETSGRIWPNRSRAANSAVLGPIWRNFELVRDLMDVLVTCKNEEDPIKNEGTRVDTTFSPL